MFSYPAGTVKWRKPAWQRRLHGDNISLRLRVKDARRAGLGLCLQVANTPIIMLKLHTSLEVFKAAEVSSLMKLSVVAEMNSWIQLWPQSVEDLVPVSEQLCLSAEHFQPS